MIFNLYIKKGCVYCKEMHILLSYKICFDFNHTWYSHTRSEKFDYSIRTFRCLVIHFSLFLSSFVAFFEARFSAYWKKISSGTEYLIDLFCFSFLLLHSDDLNCIYVFYCCYSYKSALLFHLFYLFIFFLWKEND